MKGNILVSDLEIEVEKEIIITKNLVRKLLSGKNKKQSTLDNCFNVAHDFSKLTRREINFIIHSNLPRKLIYSSGRKKYEGINLKKITSIAIPAIGTKKDIPEDPQLDLNIYEDEIYDINEKDEIDDINEKLVLYLPIIDLHSHPSTTDASASDGDLRNAKASYEITLILEDFVLEITNPKIHAIISTSQPFHESNVSFYQYTGNESALDSFLENYDKKNSLKSSKFIQELEDCDVCKTLYFPGGSLFDLNFKNGEMNYMINNDSMKKIAKKFKYSIKIERIE